MVHAHLVVVVMAAIHAMLTRCTRFRLPVDPYLCMEAAFTAAGLLVRPSPASAQRAP